MTRARWRPHELIKKNTNQHPNIDMMELRVRYIHDFLLHLTVLFISISVSLNKHSGDFLIIKVKKKRRINEESISI
jgi:hypothetical protein